MSAYILSEGDEDIDTIYLTIVFKPQIGEFVAPKEEPHLDDLM